MRATFTAAALLLIAVVAQGQGVTGPTVGDPIELDLGLKPGERAELETLDAVELLDQLEGRVIVRGFEPGTHALRFTATDAAGNTRQITGAVEIASVLHPDDDLEPAPLAPPLPFDQNHAAWIAIGIVAAGAGCSLALSVLGAASQSNPARQPASLPQRS